MLSDVAMSLKGMPTTSLVPRALYIASGRSSSCKCMAVDDAGADLHASKFHNFAGQIHSLFTLS